MVFPISYSNADQTCVPGSFPGVIRMERCSVLLPLQLGLLRFNGFCNFIQQFPSNMCIWEPPGAWPRVNFIRTTNATHCKDTLFARNTKGFQENRLFATTLNGGRARGDSRLRPNSARRKAYPCKLFLKRPFASEWNTSAK